jgi:hypothetical protein
MKHHHDLVSELITYPQLNVTPSGEVWSHDFSKPLGTEQRHTRVFWNLPKIERSYRDRMPDYEMIYKDYLIELNYWHCESEGCCMSCYHGRCSTYSIKSIKPLPKYKSFFKLGSVGCGTVFITVILFCTLLLMSMIISGNLLNPL